MLMEEGGLERLQELFDGAQTTNDVRELAHNVLDIVNGENIITTIDN